MSNKNPVSGEICEYCSYYILFQMSILVNCDEEIFLKMLICAVIYAKLQKSLCRSTRKMIVPIEIGKIFFGA
jgi:hypothetical protein